MAPIAEHRIKAEIVVPVTTRERGLNDKGELEVEIHVDVEHARLEVGGETIAECSLSHS